MAEFVELLRYEADIADVKRKLGEMRGQVATTQTAHDGRVKVMGKAWDGFKGVVGGAIDLMKKVGVAAGAGLGAAAAFGVKAAATFSGAGKEILKLQRYTGGSAEEMSKLRFAAQQTGIDTDALAKGLGQLSKHLAANDKAAALVGVSFKNARGEARPLNDVLLDVADKFAKMPNGVEKNRMALALFGRAGMDLVPILNRGKQGIIDLTAEAQKYGQVLTQDNLDSIRKNAEAHRQWSAAMQGLQIQIGQYVLPILTTMAQFATSQLLPAIGLLADFTREHVAPAFQRGFDLAQKAMATVVTFAQRVLFPAVREVVEQIIGLMRPLGERIRAALNLAVDAGTGLVDKLAERFPKLGAAARDGLGAVQEHAVALTGAFAGVIQTVAILPLVWGVALVALAALVAGIIYAYNHSERFREVVQTVATAVRDGLGAAVEWVRANWPTFQAAFAATVDFLQTKVMPVISAVAGYITEQFGNVVAWVQSMWPQFSEAIGHVMNVVEGIIRTVVDVVSALWRAWGDDLLHMVQTVWNYIQETIENALQVIRGIIQVVVAIINGDWGKAWDGIKAIVGAVWDQIGNIISTAVGLVKEIIAGLGSTLGQMWPAIWGGLQDAVGAAWDAVVGIGRGAVNIIIDQINGIIGAINGLIGAYNKLPMAPNIPKIPTVGHLAAPAHHVAPTNKGKQFHSGGVYRAPTLGGEGLALLRDQEVVLTPEQAQSGGGLGGFDYDRLSFVLAGAVATLPQPVIVVDRQKLGEVTKKSQDSWRQAMS